MVGIGIQCIKGRWSTDFRRTDKPHEFSASTRMCRTGIYTRGMPKVFTLLVKYKRYLHRKVNAEGIYTPSEVQEVFTLKVEYKRYLHWM